ncbi:acyl-CoA thioester hydrolase [Deinobacterium chartae]|uniref:Acyl-CoA thioester hydrolase n=1 Tax=Deinobacterium chartae TaxID=521158 RepID=A0A841I603_9DEIO|nr:thioesterase family protein [Deinobacterium chartae]MBB6099860.1 acyl-CoA thioester hydrolase [Deinobacterium chartae]
MEDRRRYQQPITVTRADIDDLGHVNNAVYLRYVEDVARAHADAVSMSLEVLRTLGAVPVVRRHIITYHRPALEGEQLTVSTRLISASGVRATRHNEVRRTSDNALLAEADTEWVWVNPASGRPRPVPLEVMQAFGMLESDPA